MVRTEPRDRGDLPEPSAPRRPGAADGKAIAASGADPERFAEIFDRHWTAIHRYVAWRLGAEMAEDVAADVFLTAFRSRDRYDPTRPDARPWLYGIATNLIGQHRRTERRRTELLARTEAVWASESFVDRSDARIAAERLRPRLVAVLSRLPAADRDLLLLVAWADLTYEETAHALGVPIGTVRSRLHRVRKKVRRALGGANPTAPAEEPA